jgi:hypothetical protein
MAHSDENCGRSRRPGAVRAGDGEEQVGYLVAGRSGGRVMLCVVCTVHEEIRSASFLVELQNQGQWFISGLTSNH